MRRKTRTATTRPRHTARRRRTKPANQVFRRLADWWNDWRARVSRPNRRTGARRTAGGAGECRAAATRSRQTDEAATAKSPPERAGRETTAVDKSARASAGCRVQGAGCGAGCRVLGAECEVTMLRLEDVQFGLAVAGAVGAGMVGGLLLAFSVSVMPALARQAGRSRHAGDAGRQRRDPESAVPHALHGDRRRVPGPARWSLTRGPAGGPGARRWPARCCISSASSASRWPSTCRSTIAWRRSTRTGATAGPSGGTIWSAGPGGTTSARRAAGSLGLAWRSTLAAVGLGWRAEATLVLLPGLDGTAAMFGPLLASLPPWIRPVVVTYPPSGPNGYDDLLPLVQRAIAGHAAVPRARAGRSAGRWR